MSYDIYFYKKKDSTITETSFAEYLTKNLPFNTSDHPKQWSYENPDTGVYFWLEWNDASIEEEDVEFYDQFDDYINLNFVFGINFARPEFFGLEVFPVLEKIINDNDLYVLNPQDEQETEHPTKYPPGYLQDQWIRHNRKVIPSMTEYVAGFYPTDKSNFLWTFMYNREKIQSSLLEDIFVVGYFMVKRNSDGKLYTAGAWTQHIPIVLPPVDYVIIRKKIKSFFRTKEESGVVSYDLVMEKFGKYFEPYQHEIPGLKILRQENADLLAKEFNKLEVIPVEEFGAGVAFDKFVNVDSKTE